MPIELISCLVWNGASFVMIVVEIMFGMNLVLVIDHIVPLPHTVDEYGAQFKVHEVVIQHFGWGVSVMKMICDGSSSQMIEGSKDAFKSNAKLNGTAQHCASSRLDHAVSSIIGSNKKSVCSSDKIGSRNMKDDNAGFAHMPYLNVSYEEYESKGELKLIEQISNLQLDTNQHASLIGWFRTKDSLLKPIYQKKQSKQLSASGEIKDQALENDGSFHQYGNIKQSANVKHTFTESSCQFFSPSGLQQHKQNVGSDSVSYMHTNFPYMHLNYISLLDQILECPTLSSTKSENNGNCSSTNESSYASDKVHSIESSSGPSVIIMNEYITSKIHMPRSKGMLSMQKWALVISTKLCIRDSLYRLARSVEQRHNWSNTEVDSADTHLSTVENSSECHVCSVSGHVRANVSSGQEKWIIDSGATHHTTPDASKVVNGTDYNGPGKLVVGNGHSLNICKTGHAVIPTRSRALVVNDLLHVPSITKNLIYVSKFARDNDVYFEFHAKQCLVKDEETGEVLLQGQEVNGLYQFAGLEEVNNSCAEVHFTSQQGQLCKHGLTMVHGAREVCTDPVVSPTTITPVTMSGRDEHEGQVSAGDEGRQENVASVGDIGVEVQSDRVDSDFEVPSTEPNVEVTLEGVGQSGGELSCSGGLMSGGIDETTEIVVAVPEVRDDVVVVGGVLRDDQGSWFIQLHREFRDSSNYELFMMF
ncbi:hypothetical protein GQ457_15G012620 [Hibiscus cannabinus]